MDNPYEAPVAVSPVADENVGRRRGAVWKSLLIAYAVHHAAGALGFIADYLFDAGTLSGLFGGARTVGFMLGSMPFCDLWMIVGPLRAGDGVPATFVALLWLRSLVTISTLAAIVGYAVHRHSAWLWYIGIFTFVLFASLASRA